MRTIRLIASIGLLVVTSINAEGTKVGGFVDAQYHWDKGGNNQGFVVNDGAVYLNHDMATCSAVIDLPFTGTQTALTGANFTIAQTKMQAFVTHKYDNGLGWKLGQFDTPFGLEARDSKDNAMARTGIVSGVLPTVHTGVWADYAIGGTKLNFLVANQRDNNQLNRPGTAGTRVTDLGVQVTTGLGGINLAVGGLFNKVAGETGYLIDAVVSAPLSSVNLGFELAMQKTAGAADTTMGIVGLVGYAINDTMGLDARVSYLAKATAAVDSQMEISVGPNFSMSKAMKCKVHYTMLTTTAATGLPAVESTSSAVISSVVSF